MSRIRTRSGKPSNGVIEYYQDGRWYVLYNTTPYPNGTETFIDDDSKTRFDPCLIRPMSKVVYDRIPSQVTAATYLGTYPARITNPGWFGPYRSSLPTFDDNPTLFQGLVNSTLSDVSGRMPEDQQVNVMELLLDIIKPDFTLEIPLANLRKLFKAGLSPTDNLKKVARDSSELWLTWSFVLKPLIADARNLASMIKNVQDRLNQLSIRNGRTFFTIKKTAVESKDIDFDGHSSCNARRTTTLTSYWHADYDISDFNATKLMLQSIGFATPLSTAWDVIPFSFLLDYFISVQNSLRELDTRLNKGLNCLTIGRANLISCGVTSVVEAEVKNKFFFPGFTPDNYIDCGTTTNRSVQRIPLPNSTLLEESALNEAGLTLNRSLNIGALFVGHKLRK